MKHVMLKYVAAQDAVEKKQTTLACVCTNVNKSHLMTKCLETTRTGKVAPCGACTSATETWKLDQHPLNNSSEMV